MGGGTQSEPCQTSIGQVDLTYMKGIYFYPPQEPITAPRPFSGKLALKGWARVHSELKIFWERPRSRLACHLN